MTALADSPAALHDRSAHGGPDAGPAVIAGPSSVADRSGAVRNRARTVRSWPLLLLAFPAAAEVWSGWVGIAQKTGFGLVSPLPGIWSSLHLDTTITLPVGVEAYAAYALRAWLATEQWITPPRTRRFAKWSAICSFALGMAGQVTYHLLAQAGAARAPWPVTMIVSCLPVLVLAMGTALAHMLRGDAAVADAPGSGTAEPAARSTDLFPEDQLADRPDQDQAVRTMARTGPPSGTGKAVIRHGSVPASRTEHPVLDPAHPHKEQALRVARELADAGRPVSRRALRSGGVKGSNEALSALARMINAEQLNEGTILP